MNPTCMECSKPLLGRADKKFCDDQCRTAYHNRQNKDSTKLMRTINNRLKRNRRILQTLWEEFQQHKVPVSRLYETGYDFRYATHTRRTESGREYVFCYDVGITRLEEEQACLIQKDETATAVK